jgi:hypothetical protein
MMSHEVPETKCLECGKRLNEMTDGLLFYSAPSPGDLTICAHCGHMMAFTKTMRLRQLTKIETGQANRHPEVQQAQRVRLQALRERQ